MFHKIKSFLVQGQVQNVFQVKEWGGGGIMINEDGKNQKIFLNGQIMRNNRK